METKYKTTNHSDAYREGILGIAVMYAAEYQKNKDNMEACLSKYHSMSSIMSLAYELLVQSGEIEPIESLDESYKRRLWEDAVEWSNAAGVAFNKKNCIRLSKSIWLLNILLENC